MFKLIDKGCDFFFTLNAEGNFQLRVCMKSGEMFETKTKDKLTALEQAISYCIEQDTE